MVFHAVLFKAMYCFTSRGFMFHHHRATTLLLTPTFFFLSVTAAISQNRPDNDRVFARNTRAPVHQTRVAASADSKPGTSKLPFETSVIIYYGAPANKNSTTDQNLKPGSASKTAGTPDSAKQKITAKSLPDPVTVSGPAAPRPSFVPTLSPVIIYFRGFQPLAATAKSDLTPRSSSFASEPVREEMSERASTVTQKVEPNISKPKAFRPSSLFAGSPIEARPDSIVTDLLPLKISETPAEPPELIAAEANAAGSVLVIPESSLVEKTLLARQLPSLPVEPGAGNLAEGSSSEFPSKENKIDTPSATAGTADSALTVSPPASQTTNVPPSAAGEAQVIVAAVQSSATAASPTSNVDVVSLNNEAVKETLESNYDAALEHLQRAIEARPDVAKFYRNLSIVYERMKRVDDALAAARTAEKLAPGVPSVLEQLCALEVMAKNVANGLSCYESLQKIEPLDILGQTYYAAALFHSGKVDESLGILEKVVQTTPTFPDALNALGVVYYTKKRIPDAIAMFKSAVEATPDQSQTRYNLGVAELANGNKAAAISQYNIIKSVDPKLADQLYRGIYGDRLLFVGGPEGGKH
jgi:Flp pilus assembly protein TadD